jgi:hypothetical protein
MKTIFDQLDEVNHSSPIYCLPRWVSKTIEFVGADVEDVSSKQETRSQRNMPTFP